jgi:hypothetical protein
MQLNFGAISAAPSLVNSLEVAGPVVVRRITFRAQGGNQNVMQFRPTWNVTPRGYETDTPLLGPFGTTTYLHSPVSRAFTLRFEHVVTAPRFHFRLAVQNPTAPLKRAFSSWLIERARDMPRQGTITVNPFFEDALAASTRVTLVSSTCIPYAFAIDEIVIIFGAGAQGNVRVSFWAEDNDGAPTSAEPDGRPLLGGFGSVRWIAGDNTVIRLRPSDLQADMIVPERGMFLKVHAHNTDASAAHDVNAVVTLRQLVDYEG